MTGPRVVDLPAPPRQRGEAHGEELRDLVAAGLSRWRDDLAATGADPAAWIADFMAATDFLPAIAGLAPDVVAEVEGLAAATGTAFEGMADYHLFDSQG